MPAMFWPGIGTLVGLALIILLGQKWEFDKLELVVSSLIIGVLSVGIATIATRYADLPGIAFTVLTVALILALFAAHIFFRFFRDPDRKSGGKETQILSPADGRIIYVKNIKQGEVPNSKKHGITFRLDELTGTDLLVWGGCLIGISMSFLDVHVNRAPISGNIVLMHRVKGSFLSLKRPEAVFQNERAVTVIESKTVQVGIVQITSRLVRSIVAYKKTGDEVFRGERIGMIRFGSQVDLVLPKSPLISLSIKVGDRVKAGESIIGELQQRPAASREIPISYKP